VREIVLAYLLNGDDCLALVLCHQKKSGVHLRTPKPVIAFDYRHANADFSTLTIADGFWPVACIWVVTKSVGGAGDAFDGAVGASGYSVIALRPDLEVVPAAQLVDFFWWPHDFGNVALDVRGIPPRLGGRKGSYFAQASGKSPADPFDGLLRLFVQTYQLQRDCRPLTPPAK